MFSEEEQTSPTSSSSSPPPSSHFIGRKEDVVQAKRVTKLVGGRDVLVLCHQGKLHAMDMRCYHTGGPLQEGDIEEIDGRMCIVCPWHKYKITLAEGEGLYQAVNPSATPPKPTWRSKGVKQRVHQVTEVNRDVYVTFNDSPDTIDSDFYQTERYRATINKTQPKTKKLLEKVTSRKV
ncbi:Rieske domain-containing protein [Oncorhynchus kisutch]|uniref:Rieske domain-containing protein n=1 Tax=Oncorhynchus kisutch TaxID=8019 RepID=A0A8C7C8F0_ONCKI|nr:Rieske domain-containing protein [Oncorhynchus kisutch]